MSDPKRNYFDEDVPIDPSLAGPPVPQGESDASYFADLARPPAPPSVSAPAPQAPPQTIGHMLTSALNTSADAARAFNNAVTFGNMDRALGAYNYLTGNAPSYSAGVNQSVAQSQAQRDRSPYASIAGDVAGNVATSVALPVLSGDFLAAKIGTTAPGLLTQRGLISRTLASGLTGAGIGAAQGAGNTYTGNWQDYVSNATRGGMMGGILGAAGGAILGTRPTATDPNKISLTVDDVKNAADQGYDSLRANTARYDPASAAQRANDLEAQLRSYGYVEKGSPISWEAVKTMRQGSTTTPGADVTPNDLETVRQIVNKIKYSPANAADHEAAGFVRRAVDDFLMNPPEGAVRPGTEAAAADVAGIAAEARGNWSSYKKAQLVQNRIDAAENQTTGTFSGMNADADIRHQAKAMLNPLSAARKAEISGFTPAEYDALVSVRNGDPTRNFLRFAGNLGGGGGGIGSTMLGGVMGTAGSTIGAATGLVSPGRGAVIGGAIPAIGFGARLAANELAKDSINNVENMILQNSPLGRSLPSTIPTTYPISGWNWRDYLATQLLRGRNAP